MSEQQTSVPATPFDDPELPLSSPIFTPKPKHHKKATGKPKGRPSERAAKGLSPSQFLDKPPRYKMEWSAFHKYWVEQYQKHSDCVLVYVYRHFPVLDVNQLDPAPPKYVLKISEPLDEEQFIKQLGCGDYYLMLNGIAEGKALCNTTLRTHRDFTLSPPQLNLDTLVIHDPQNVTYINYLRLAGVRVPGLDPLADAKEKGDKEEMAATEALTEVIKDQQNMLREQINKPQIVAAPIRQQTVDTDAMSRTIELVADTAKQQNAALFNTLQSINDMNKANNDPVKMLSGIADLAKTMFPPKDDGLLQELIKSNRETQAALERERSERMASLERELAAQRVANSTGNGSGGTTGPGGTFSNQPKSLVDQMKEMKEVKDTFEHLLGGDSDSGRSSRRNSSSDSDSDSESGFSFWKVLGNNFPLILTASTSLFGMAATMLHNSAVARTGVGEPMAPPPPPPVPAHYGSIPGFPAVPAGPVMRNQMPAPGPQSVTDYQTVPQPQPQQDDPSMNIPGLSQYHAYLETIRVPLLRSFGSSEEDGVDFAASFIAFQGREPYDELKTSGKATLMMLIKSYPPIWDVVSPMAGKFSVFLDEFLDYDQLAAAEGYSDHDNGEAGQREN